MYHFNYIVEIKAYKSDIVMVQPLEILVFTATGPNIIFGEVLLPSEPRILEHSIFQEHLSFVQVPAGTESSRVRKPDVTCSSNLSVVLHKFQAELSMCLCLFP